MVGFEGSSRKRAAGKSIGGGGTPMLDITPTFGGGGPQISVMPDLAEKDNERAMEVALNQEIDDETDEEKEELIRILREENSKLRRGESIQGIMQSPSSAILKEGAIRLFTGEEDETATLTIVTLGMMRELFGLFEEKINKKLDEEKERIDEEMKEVKEAALPLLNMLKVAMKSK